MQILKPFFNFDTFIFPRIATIVYWIGIVLISLSAIIAAFGSLFMSVQYGNGFGAGLMGFLAALVGGMLGLLAWRLLVEFWLVIFSIRDTLREIADQGRRP